MAKARLYAITAKALKNEPKGQAARVLEELRNDATPRLATDIDLAIATSATPHKTRQDSLRVTLYYLLIFKKQGIVAASEQAETEDAVAVADENTDAKDVEDVEDAEVDGDEIEEFETVDA